MSPFVSESRQLGLLFLTFESVSIRRSWLVGLPELRRVRNKWTHPLFFRSVLTLDRLQRHSLDPEEIETSKLQDLPKKGEGDFFWAAPSRALGVACANVATISRHKNCATSKREGDFADGQQLDNCTTSQPEVTAAAESKWRRKVSRF